MIKINEKWFIDVDTRSYVLCEDLGIKVNRKGKEQRYTKTIGWYSSVSDCLVALQREILREKFSKNDYNFKEAISEIKKTNESLQKYFAKLECPYVDKQCGAHAQCVKCVCKEVENEQENRS